jgi:hypothetical protein
MSDISMIAGTIVATCAVLGILGKLTMWLIDGAKNFLTMSLSNAVLSATAALKTELNGRYPQKAEIYARLDAVERRLDDIASAVKSIINHFLNGESNETARGTGTPPKAIAPSDLDTQAG